MIDKTKSSDEWRVSAKNKRIRGLVATELLQLFETHNDTTVAVHLINILRSKGRIEDRVAGSKPDGAPKYRDPYFLKDEEFLKDLQNYRTELEKVTDDDE